MPSIFSLELVGFIECRLRGDMVGDLCCRWMVMTMAVECRVGDVGAQTRNFVRAGYGKGWCDYAPRVSYLVSNFLDIFIQLTYSFRIL